jgi:hypothetical protein
LVHAGKSAYNIQNGDQPGATTTSQKSTALNSDKLAASVLSLSFRPSHDISMIDSAAAAAAALQPHLDSAQSFRSFS